MRLFLLALLLLPSFLFADGYYTSNAIGQVKESIPMLTGVGYEVEERGNEKLFYLDGSVIKRELQEQDKRITQEGDKTTEIISKNGLVQEERIKEGETLETIKYEYSDNGILNKMVKTIDGSLQSVTIYSYDPSTLLSAIRSDDDTSLLSSSAYAYPEGEGLVMITVYPSFLKRDDSSVSDKHSSETDEEGNLLLKEKRGDNTLETLYSESGDIISEKLFSSDGAIISETFYTWQDDELLSKLQREGERSTETFYESGRVLYSQHYVSGKLEKRQDYLSTGMIDEIVYRDEKPYALIHYDSDGKRVLALEML